MRTLILVSAACAALAAWPSRMTEAIDDLTARVQEAIAAFVATAIALAQALIASAFERPQFAFDGPSFNPTPAHYDAPPQSFVRHESHVSRRSAARGV